MQRVSLGTHVAPQAPAEHTCPALHALPQVPQFWPSLFVLVQTIPPSTVHALCPVAHSALHALWAQTWPPAHATPHAPQLLGSKVVFVQLEPHIFWPDGHAVASVDAPSADTLVSCPPSCPLSCPPYDALLLLPQPTTTIATPTNAPASDKSIAAHGRVGRF